MPINDRKKKIAIIVALLLVGFIAVAGYHFLAGSEGGEPVLVEREPDPPVSCHMDSIYAPVLLGAQSQPLGYRSWLAEPLRSVPGRGADRAGCVSVRSLAFSARFLPDGSA